MDDIEYVADNISELSALIALVEEASELSKAAMKLARAKGLLDNPTPISVAQAESDLIEEYVCSAGRRLSERVKLWSEGFVRAYKEVQ